MLYSTVDDSIVEGLLGLPCTPPVTRSELAEPPVDPCAEFLAAGIESLIPQATPLKLNTELVSAVL